MPLSVNVGLSRKASRNYQSTGVSINVTAELDQSLLARPEELQGQIESLYQQAEQALSRGAARLGPADRSAQPAGNGSREFHDRRRNRGGTAAMTSSDAPPDSPQTTHTDRADRAHRSMTPMTNSQRRCILNICARLGTDPQFEAREILGRDFVELSLKDASKLIDHLKRVAAGGNGNNGNSAGCGRIGGGR